MIKTYYFVCLSLLLLGTGAVLASPLNKDQAYALHSQISYYREDGRIYLGTHYLYSKGYFAPDSSGAKYPLEYRGMVGVPLSDMKVTRGPNGYVPDTGDCFTMSVDGSEYYSTCNDPLPYICYKKPVKQPMNECGTVDNEYRLNQRTGSCYKVHRKQVIWSRASEICASEGAHLVILDNTEEANVIKTMFPQNVDQFSRFHVGFGSWGKERIWTTIDGRRLEDVYNNWNPGQPDNLGGIQNRGAFLKNGYLDDVGPEELPFVCEKSPKSKQN